MTVLLTAIAVWAGCGLISAAILARHGHSFWFLAFIGMGYGPFVVLVWLRAMRGQESTTTVIRHSSGPERIGWLDVMVGLDGSPAAVESTGKVLTALGPAIRRVRFVSVIDHEIANAPDAFEVDDRRAQYLEDAAESLGFHDAEISLASGRPDKALIDQATVERFDLLVVAHRRGVITSGLRGSTAGRLARTADVPVLIGPKV